MIINGINIELVRKQIKYMNLRVYAETGRVRVAAPKHYKNAVIEAFVREKAGWIKQKLQHSEPKRAELKSALSWEEGSKHLLLGRLFVLAYKSDSGKQRCELAKDESTLELLNCTAQTTDEKKLALLTSLKREVLKNIVHEILPKWEKKMEVNVSFIGIKNMKTRWGSCLPTKKRIWLALDLVHKPVECIEYVLVHELVHFYERLHNKRFHSFMTHYLPEWPELKVRLAG